MAIFVVLSRQPRNDKILNGRILELFPDDNHYRVGRGQWLLASKGTAKSVYNRIIPKGDELAVEAGIVVFRLFGYWGLARADMWEWVHLKKEAQHSCGKGPTRTDWAATGDTAGSFTGNHAVVNSILGLYLCFRNRNEHAELTREVRRSSQHA